LETEEGRILVMESVLQRGKSVVLISLEADLSGPNPDVIEACKHNSAIVTFLESY
jgi:hypothetical protein